MSRKGLLLALATVVAGAAAACIDTLDPDVGELTAGVCKNADSDSENEISFKDQVLPKLQMGCSCHSPTGTGTSIDSTGFSVGDYGAIRRGGTNSRDKIVIAGEPCNSFIYQKMSDGPPTGSRMPSNGPYWSRADMALLHDWIAEGAHAN